MRKHLGLKQWKCDHCDRAFEKYTSLTLHVAAKHYGDGEKPIFTCDIDGCDKSYTMKVKYLKTIFFEIAILCNFL